MKKKKVRRKYFNLKELRLSVAHMILWTLLAVAFFTYLAIEIGSRIERSTSYFLFVIAVYVIIVVVLTLFFTHRFIGPFERLKIQLRIIQSGNYDKRLTIREHDDLYIRSFVQEVNKLIDSLERKYSFKKSLRDNIYSELSEIRALAGRDETSREELGRAIDTFHEKFGRFIKG
jgi:hypothetical protein